MELYQWQRECLAAWEKNGYRGIVRAVTGAGKTKLALEAIRRLWERRPQLRVAVVVPTIPLARQWQSALRHAAEGEEQFPGVFGGGKRDGSGRRVMIYIINSARDALAAHLRRELALGHPCLLICDECHHVQSLQNRRIFGFLTPEIEAGSLYCSLGLSATPFGTDNDEVLTRGLGREVFRYDFPEAGTDGVISPFLIGEVSVPFLPEEKEAYDAVSAELGTAMKELMQEHPELWDLRGTAFLRRVSNLACQADMDPEDPAAAYLRKAYQRKEIAALAETRLSCALALLETVTPSDRILIFCERIEQAERLTAMIRHRWGSGCGIYHSKLSPEARRRNLRDFREHRTRVLVSCRCLDEGIDVPDANVGIVLSGTAVERQRIQRLGRILRAAPGKDSARLYYLYVRDSAEGCAYLPGTDDSLTFPLRYEPLDGSFAEELYTYSANRLLKRAGQGCTEAQLRELRRCLTEGLPRGDYLLDPQLLEQRERSAASVHERNYWKTMRRMNADYRKGTDEPAEE